MNYFDLPLLFTNKQLVHIRLWPELNPVADPLETTIIPVEVGKVRLFSTLSNKIIGTTLADDFTFTINAITQTGKEIKIELIQIEESTPISAHINSIKAEISESDRNGLRTFQVDYDDAKDIDTILFSINIGNINYIGKRKIAFARKEQIVDIAIDFGSEASQMTIRNLNDERLRRFPIADNLHNFFYTSLTEKFHQKETNELFRSLFFIKLKDAELHLANEPGYSNELIPLLTEVDEIDTLIEDYQLVSTLKLANTGAFDFLIDFNNHYNGIQGANFDAIVQDVQQVIINGFLHAAFKEIKRGLPPETDYFIRLKLLVPNVLAQSKISSLVSKTNTFFQAITVSNKHFKAFQTATLSESDASFLGYWSAINANNNHNKEANTRFIIIDMGKGTTDFSIISSNEKYELTSEFRSGFVGAGNVITYAFIETIFTLIFGKDEKKKRKALKTYLLKKADNFQLEFLGLVEELKANYGSDKNRLKKVGQMSFSTEVQEILKSSDIKAIQESEILQFIKEIKQNQLSIQDEFGYIQKAIVGLVTKLKETIQNYIIEDFSTSIQNTKLILTGRSFLFYPLYEAIQETFPGITTIRLDNVSDKTWLKKVCLEGAYGGVNLNYNSNLSGFPNIVEVKKIEGTNSVLTLKKVTDKNWKSWLQKIKPITGTLGSIGFLASDDEEPLGEDRTPVVEKPKINPETDDKTIELSIGQFGLKKKFIQERDTLNISGVHYNLELHSKDEFKLYYDGEALFARTENERVSLFVPAKFALNTPFLFETLFPFNSHIPEDEIIVQPDISAIPIL